PPSAAWRPGYRYLRPGGTVLSLPAAPGWRKGNGADASSGLRPDRGAALGWPPRGENSRFVAFASRPGNATIGPSSQDALPHLLPQACRVAFARAGQVPAAEAGGGKNRRLFTGRPARGSKLTRGGETARFFQRGPGGEKRSPQRQSPE